MFYTPHVSFTIMLLFPANLLWLRRSFCRTCFTKPPRHKDTKFDSKHRQKKKSPSSNALRKQGVKEWPFRNMMFVENFYFNLPRRLTSLANSSTCWAQSRGRRRKWGNYIIRHTHVPGQRLDRSPAPRDYLCFYVHTPKNGPARAISKYVPFR